MCTCRYPYGYSLIFIPYYSPAYTGYHWGVYNEQNNFYGFDEGDASSGEPFTVDSSPSQGSFSGVAVKDRLAVQ